MSRRETEGVAFLPLSICTTDGYFCSVIRPSQGINVQLVLDRKLRLLLMLHKYSFKAAAVHNILAISALAFLANRAENRGEKLGRRLNTFFLLLLRFST